MGYESEDWIQLVQVRLVTGSHENDKETSGVTRGMTFLISQKTIIFYGRILLQGDRMTNRPILETFLTFHFIMW
jgi:hypothetical protein